MFLGDKIIFFLNSRVFVDNFNEYVVIESKAIMNTPPNCFESASHHK